MRIALLVLAIGLGACADRDFAPRPTRSAEAVYEAVLDIALFSDWGRDTVELVGPRPRLIRLGNEFWVHPPNADHAETIWWLRQSMPSIPQQLAEAYAQRPVVGGVIPSDLRARVPLQLRPVDDIESDYVRYGIWASLIDLVLPTSQVVLSPAVFSPDSLQVLVEVSTYRRDWQYASGVLVWLRWSGGEWRIAGYAQTWVT